MEARQPHKGRSDRAPEDAWDDAQLDPFGQETTDSHARTREMAGQERDSATAEIRLEERAHQKKNQPERRSRPD